MGFWSGLGKVLSVAAPIAAIPFTGGASAAGLKAALPAILGGAGAALGGMSGAASQNRGEQDALNINRDALRLREAEMQERAGLDRADLELRQRAEGRTAESDAYGKAMQGSLAKNLQDVSFSGGFRGNVPKMSFSGGLRPSAFGAEGKEAGAVLNNLAMQRLLSGGDPLSMPAMPERVSLSEPGKASFWEKLAGPLSMGLNVAGMAAGARQPAPRPAGIGAVSGIVGSQVPGAMVPAPTAPPPPPPAPVPPQQNPNPFYWGT